MNFNEFVQLIIDYTEELSAIYESAIITFHKGKVFLQVMDHGISTFICMKCLYEICCDENIYEVHYQINKLVQEFNEDILYNLKFDHIKENIFPFLYNKEAVKNHFVYEEKVSIAICPELVIIPVGNPNIFHRINITKDLLNSWNITLKEVMKIAYKNLKKDPVNICIIKDGQEFSQSLFECSFPKPKEFIITSESQNAAVLFLPEVLKKIGEIYDENYFVTFPDNNNAVFSQINQTTAFNLKNALVQNANIYGVCISFEPLVFECKCKKLITQRAYKKRVY